jgi:hypothetical protein
LFLTLCRTWYNPSWMSGPAEFNSRLYYSVVIALLEDVTLKFWLVVKGYHRIGLVL